MFKMLFKVRHFTFILVAVVFIIYGNHFEDFSKLKEDIKIYPTPDLKYFSLGYTNAVANSLWLNFLQNPDYCETPEQAKAYNAGTNLEEILEYDIPPSRCHKGWVYQTLNTITELDPKFYPAYVNGATMLAVAVDDRYGSKEIFDKGLKQFPNDWVLNYRAFYLYIYELQDPPKAAELLMTAYKNGGPDFLPSLAARLYNRIGQAVLGKAILEEFIQNQPDSSYLERAKERLKEIQKSLQQ